MWLSSGSSSNSGGGGGGGGSTKVDSHTQTTVKQEKSGTGEKRGREGGREGGRDPVVIGFLINLSIPMWMHVYNYDIVHCTCTCMSDNVADFYSYFEGRTVKKELLYNYMHMYMYIETTALIE